jgi:RNA polymerase sigma-70 factor, ECF subfamily
VGSLAAQRSGPVPGSQNDAPAPVICAVALDRDLVIAARGGATWAVDALYRRYSKMAFRIASALARPSDRDDVVQESFLQAFGSLHRLRNPELFASWLASVVRMVARIFYRRSQLARERFDPAPLEDLASAAAPLEILADLRTVHDLLERFPVEPRLAFVLSRVGHMPVHEIAVRMGRSVATVKRRLARAESLLARRLRPRRAA